MGRPAGPEQPGSSSAPPPPGQGYPSAPPPPPGEAAPGWGQPAYGAPGQPAPGGYHTYGTPTPYAEWIKRVGAYLVDVAVVLPGYLVMLVGAPMMGGDNGGLAAIGVVLYFAGVAAVLGLAIWDLVLRQGRTGWSIGKQVLGIRLIAEKTGEPLGPGLTFVRMLAHVLDQLPCYLGFLWPLWDPKKQTFADKIMSSVVIEQPKPPTTA